MKERKRLRNAALRAMLAACALSAAACSDDASPDIAAPRDAGQQDAGDGGCGILAGAADGGCAFAGVPSDGCAKGFTSDGRGGCSPILPPGPCPVGMMALPGETTCHVVAPCGVGTWGDIPIEADTQFVDRAYAGADSDGSKAKPWTSVQTAIDNADDGAIVAIAEGIYPEGPYLIGKSVRIWGRCPAKVTLAGADAVPAIDIAFSAEVHDISLMSSTTFGALLGPGDPIVLDRVWIHDTADLGVLVTGLVDPTSITISRSLIERAAGAGILVSAATALLDGIVVRNGQSADSFGPGRGIDVEDDPDTGAPSHATIRDSVIEHDRESGIVVFGSEASIESTVVRNIEADDLGKHGVGIAIQPGKIAGSKGSVAGSVIDGDNQEGVSVIASELSIDTTVVRNTLAQPLDALYGDNLCALEGSTVDANRSLFSKAARASIANFGASVTVSRCAFECNPIDIDGEKAGADFVFEDLGGNVCRCGDTVSPCEILSANLKPPDAIQ